MLIDTTNHQTNRLLLDSRVCNSPLNWYVLHTRSHCEKLVYDQLAAKGFQLFLPAIETWTKRAGLRKVVCLPLFTGYLFLHHVMDKCSYIEVLKARGLVTVLREGEGQLAVVSDAEIDSLRSIIQSRLPILSHPYLREGQRVRITYGALAGIEGLLLQTKLDKGLFVLSINLLQRSIAVKIDCTAVEAV